MTFILHDSRLSEKKYHHYAHVIAKVVIYYSILHKNELKI